MERFDCFLLEAQRRVGLEPIPLIRDWSCHEISCVIDEVRSAATRSGVIKSNIPNFEGTNQSKGNQAERYVIDRLNPCFADQIKIESTNINGYPDRILCFGTKRFCLEVKATSNWDENDTLRRVLTASPSKIRSLIKSGDLENPPAHVVLTVIYCKENAIVNHIRIDFLGKCSMINVRYEASTSQRLLSSGQHRSVVISNVSEE